MQLHQDAEGPAPSTTPLKHGDHTVVPQRGAKRRREMLRQCLPKATAWRSEQNAAGAYMRAVQQSPPVVRSVAYWDGPGALR